MMVNALMLMVLEQIMALISVLTAIMVLSHNAGLYTGMVQVIALNHTTVTRF